MQLEVLNIKIRINEWMKFLSESLHDDQHFCFIVAEL